MTSRSSLPKQPRLPFSVEMLVNPSQATLRELAFEHTAFCERTVDGSINKISRNKSRVAGYTYIIDRQGDPSAYSHNTIKPADAQKLIEGQAAYIQAKGKLLIVQGWIGLGERAVPVEWAYTVEGANIAGMQQILAFPRERVEGPDAASKPFEPAFRLIYTPDHFVDMPGKQAIIVDLENYVTYVMGSDYFGESKKGALRMLAAFNYRRGGLVMHAGAKEISRKGERLTMGILGLSGTGKTTTTFSKQGESTRPVQDDMITLWPGGEISITENGCFAKTFGLTLETEPAIYKGTISGDAWLENVYVDEQGKPDFSKQSLTPAEVDRMRKVLLATGAPLANIDAYVSGSVKLADVVDADGVPNDGWDFVVWTENGRSILPMSAVEDAADLDDVVPVESLGILNRDEGLDAATPGIVRFTSPAQAAGYLMLGETSKTSAAGKERGKTRSPFTQPFFPLAHSLQAERFSELAATFKETVMWEMNTGYIGGDAHDEAKGKALKVKIRHSSAMLEALLAGTIAWTLDPEFGYEIVDVDDPRNADLVSKVPVEILQPKRYYAAHGRMAEYDAWVAQMKKERKSFLEKFAVSAEIVQAVVRAA
ncbi:phosphoenolpyruvate carboxykinase (ATP) [Nannocystaceae bacterium ST9]